MKAAALFNLALVLIPAYLIGSIPFGLLISRLRGIDIRKHGSGNIGATNVWRTLGPRWGLPTFLLDAAKGFLAVCAAEWIAWWRAEPPVPTEYLAYAGAFAGIACILGHSFPVWLNFQGGKGVATALGVILTLMPPIASAVVFGIWILVFALSRYVSLASILAALSLPLTVAFLWNRGTLDSSITVAFACASAFLVIRRHRENIRRLLAGTENRFGPKKNP